MMRLTRRSNQLVGGVGRRTPNRLNLLVLLSVVATASGCFGGEAPLAPKQALAKAAAQIDAVVREAGTLETPEAPAPGKRPSNPNVVSFWFYQHPLYSNLLSHPELLAGFQNQHPGVKLKDQFIGEWYVAVQKLTVSVAAGDVPDVAVVKRSWLERLVHSGRAAALDTLLPASLVDDLREPSRKALTMDGHLYGLPADGFCSVLFYNRDLVGDKAPRTWAELKSKAMALGAKSAGSAQNRVYPLGAIPYLETLWSCGGAIVKGSHSGLSDPEALEALNFLLGLRSSHLIYPGALGNSDRAFDLFLAGRVAMTVASSANLARTRGCKFHVGVAPVPGKNGPLSILSDNAIVVFNRYAEAKQPALAAVLDFLTGPKIQGKNAAALGSAPVRKSVMSGSVLAGLDEAYRLGRGTPLRPRWNEMEFDMQRYVGLAYLWHGKGS